MQIEIIKTSTPNNLNSTMDFGILLNNITASIKMLHWYSDNYNVHEILGELYESLIDLFDKLQEEIIGTCKQYNVPFPSFTSDNFNPKNINCEQNIIQSYSDLSEKTKNIFCSMEFNSFVNTSNSGINNTKEDILTSINKTNYLISMVNNNH